MSAGAITVALNMQHQERSEWCWAAVSVSVDHFFHPSSVENQCQIAGTELSLQCCAGNQPAQSPGCNVPFELNTALDRLHLLAAPPVLKPMSFADIQKEINGSRPICALIKWLDKNGQPTNRGHFIAISGYRVTAAEKQFVSIADPLYGASEIDYTEFSNPHGGYRDGVGLWFASFLVKDEAAS